VSKNSEFHADYRNISEKVQWQKFDSKNIFFLIVFGGTEVPTVFYIFLCRPSEDSLQRIAIPDESPSQDSHPL
jgi:hypothetical protein